MKDLVAATARLLVEHCAAHPTGDVADACDVAVQFLHRQGFSSGDVRAFRGVVERELRKGSRLKSAQLRTPTANSGPAHAHIHATLNKTFSVPVDFSEEVDRELIGGAKLLVGDDHVDASLRGALDGLVLHLTT